MPGNQEVNPTKPIPNTTPTSPTRSSHINPTSTPIPKSNTIINQPVTLTPTAPKKEPSEYTPVIYPLKIKKPLEFAKISCTQFESIQFEWELYSDNRFNAYRLFAEYPKGKYIFIETLSANPIYSLRCFSLFSLVPDLLSQKADVGNTINFYIEAICPYNTQLKECANANSAVQGSRSKPLPLIVTFSNSLWNPITPTHSPTSTPYIPRKPTSTPIISMTDIPRPTPTPTQIPSPTPTPAYLDYPVLNVIGPYKTSSKTFDSFDIQQTAYTGLYYFAFRNADNTIYDLTFSDTFGKELARFTLQPKNGNSMREAAIPMQLPNSTLINWELKPKNGKIYPNSVYSGSFQYMYQEPTKAPTPTPTHTPAPTPTSIPTPTPIPTSIPTIPSEKIDYLKYSVVIDRAYYTIPAKQIAVEYNIIITPNLDDFASAFVEFCGTRRPIAKSFLKSTGVKKILFPVPQLSSIQINDCKTVAFNFESFDRTIRSSESVYITSIVPTSQPRPTPTSAAAPTIDSQAKNIYFCPVTNVMLTYDSENKQLKAKIVAMGICDGAANLDLYLYENASQPSFSVFKKKVSSSRYVFKDTNQITVVISNAGPGFYRASSNSIFGIPSQYSNLVRITNENNIEGKRNVADCTVTEPADNEVVLFEHENYSGECAVLKENQQDLGTLNFSNRTSSLKAGNKISYNLYAEKEFSTLLSSGRNNLRTLPQFNDKINSVKITPQQAINTIDTQNMSNVTSDSCTLIKGTGNRKYIDILIVLAGSFSYEQSQQIISSAPWAFDVINNLPRELTNNINFYVINADKIPNKYKEDMNGMAIFSKALMSDRGYSERFRYLCGVDYVAYFSSVVREKAYANYNSPHFIIYRYIDNPLDIQKVFVHEFAHAFANIADEYVYDNWEKERQEKEFYSSLPNCTDDMTCSKWKDDIIAGRAGCFPGCTRGDLYRPVNNSIMRNNWDSTLEAASFSPPALRRMIERLRQYN